MIRYRGYQNRKSAFSTQRQSGAAAVEFGMVALPFTLMVFAIIEAGLFYYRATLIESAVMDAGRFIRTGEAQEMANPEAEYRSRLCDRVMMVSCEAITIEVMAYQDYAAAISDPPQFDSDDELQSRGFSVGEANSVIVLRAAHEYRFLTPLVGTLFTGHVSPSFTLSSMAVFKNEPFDRMD